MVTAWPALLTPKSPVQTPQFVQVPISIGVACRVPSAIASQMVGSADSDPDQSEISDPGLNTTVCPLSLKANTSRMPASPSSCMPGTKGEGGGHDHVA